jgi:hypothetical protein
VVVSQDHSGYRVEGAAELRERGRKLLEVRRETTVDDRQGTIDVAEIPADPLRAEAINAVRDLLDGGHRRRV